MRVARPRDVLRRSTVFQGKRRLRDHLASIGTDDVNAEDAIRLRISEHLDHALRVEVGLGARVGAEGERANAVGNVVGPKLLLALAHPRDLGVRVHDRRDAAIVDVAVALLDVLNRRNSLLLSLVRKHRAERAVADATDMGDLRAVLRVDDHAAALI